jgi:hypothetical protein
MNHSGGIWIDVGDSFDPWLDFQKSVLLQQFHQPYALPAGTNNSNIH